MDTGRILRHLSVERDTPNVGYLNAILKAWGERIPWESVSRIARHIEPASPEAYARDAEQFYDDVLNRGLGGTCFESNTALKALLDSLGFQSTFAFCDMSESQVDNPHCALIATLDGVRYIADAGWPLPAAVPLLDEPTEAEVYVYHYFVEPAGEDRWLFRRESGTFNQTCFRLKGDPIPPDQFRARLVRDHEPNGLFLNNVIIHRIIDGRMLRFDQTKGLIERVPGAEYDIPWTPEQAADVPAVLAQIFAADEGVLRRALMQPMV